MVDDKQQNQENSQNQDMNEQGQKGGEAHEETLEQDYGTEATTEADQPTEE